MLEGAKLLEAALAAGADIEAVYVASEATHDPPVSELVERAASRGIRLHVLATGVLEAVSGTVTPQPILAVARISTVPLEHLSAASMLIVSAAVRDPGNAGTLVRSAGAAGCNGVVFCSGSVEVFNPKTVRASAGALFHLPVVSGGEAGEVLQQIGRWGIRRLAASSRGGADYAAVDLRSPFALVLGNEATGIDEGLLAHLDATVTVPMAAHAESLNVAVAAAIICFEASRQRRRADARG